MINCSVIRRRRRAIHEINMVPFIDIMLVLLIVFMVTAPLAVPSIVDLPSVGVATRRPDNIIEVIVFRDGSLQVKSNKKTHNIALQDLIAVLRNVQNSYMTIPVLISADAKVSYENVVKVMDILQQSGVARVGLSVQLSNLAKL